jgi:hypothetical protein
VGLCPLGHLAGGHHGRGGVQTKPAAGSGAEPPGRLQGPAGPGLPRRVPEIRRRLWYVLLTVPQTVPQLLAWSRWRRWHQRLAKYDHDNQRGALPVLVAASVFTYHCSIRRQGERREGRDTGMLILVAEDWPVSAGPQVRQQMSMGNKPLPSGKVGRPSVVGFFYDGPLLALPAGDGLLVAMEGVPLGHLRASSSSSTKTSRRASANS